MAKKRNSQHKRNIEEVVVPTKTETESITEKETPAESSGITIINMKPRSSRDRYNNIQETSTVDESNELEKVDTSDTGSNVAPDEAVNITTYYSNYAAIKKLDEQNDSILSLTNAYATLQTDINTLNAGYDHLISQYNNIATVTLSTQNLIADTRTEFDNQISTLYTSVDTRLKRISSDNDSKIMSESSDRVVGERLLQSSIESISNQILSITEGLEDYKARRGNLDTEVSFHFDNIDRRLDKIDIDPLVTKINSNQEISMAIQHHSILTMDFLIRTSRMLVISFVSLIFAMIAMLIVIMTPLIGLKITFGIFGIIFAAFVVYEAKYIGISIKKAKASLDDLIKDSYE